MGRSEWAVRLRCKQDAREIFEIVSEHNKQGDNENNELDTWNQNGRQGAEPDDTVGEELEIGLVLRFKGQLWITLCNGGGATLTTQYLHEHLPDHLEVKWPFHEPKGWFECRDYLTGDTEEECTLEEVLRLPDLPDKGQESAEKLAARPPPPDWDPRKALMEAFQVMAASGQLGPGVRVLQDVRLGAM